MFSFALSCALPCVPGLFVCLMFIVLVLHEQRQQVS